MKKKLSGFDIFVAAFMCIILFATLYPIIYIISVSFSSTEYIVQNKVTFFPRGFNLEAYKMIFESSKVPRAYLNTLLYASVGTLINVFLTMLTAYPLARGMKGRKFFMWIILFTMFFNGGMIPTYIIVKNLKLLNSIWAIVIPNAIWTYELIIMKSFYESIPQEMVESAKMDGASETRVLFSIFVPISKAALASISLFYLMGHWNSYLIPSIYLTDLDKMPLQVILKSMLIDDNAKKSSDVMEYAALTSEALKDATIFISILPMLLFYPYIQKFFVKGVMVGSVKG